MKKNTVKGLAAVVFALILMFTTMCTTYAETVQDDVEKWLNGLVSDYESAETEEEAFFFKLKLFYNVEVEFMHKSDGVV